MRMKKFINDPKHLVPELLEGLVLAFPSKVRLLGSNIVARAVSKAPGKVRLVTLGGSGHEPGLSGFVGEGMLDMSVAGEIFAAPGAPRCMEAIRAAAKGSEAVLLVVLNHAGDVLSGNIAMEAAKRKGINIQRVLTQDGMSSDPGVTDRRGLVGFLPVYKIAGAAAEEGVSLDDCREVAERMEQNRTHARLLLRCEPQPIPPQVRRSLNLAKTRWKSAWASTVKREPDG